MQRVARILKSCLVTTGQVFRVGRDSQCELIVKVWRFGCFGCLEVWQRRARERGKLASQLSEFESDKPPGFAF
jgi:hypothetical protein